MYKPHPIEQYKVYRFLEENFALEHFLLAPLSRFGLILEDKTGEKIAFAFLNNCVQEIPVPAPAAPETVTAFLKQFRSLTPRPVIHDFEALTRWWLNNPNPLTYQQALGMSDILYRDFLSHPLINLPGCVLKIPAVVQDKAAGLPEFLLCQLAGHHIPYLFL